MNSNEIQFPDATGTSGYDKDAVQEYLQTVSDHIDELNTTHQKELKKAVSGTASGKDSLHQSTDILTNAHNVSKRYIDEAKQRAAAILKDAETKANEITAGSRSSIDALLKDAELNAHALTSKAELKAKETTDRAAALAERFTTEANEKGQRLVAEASSFHDEANANAAQILKQASEESSRLLAAANTNAANITDKAEKGLQVARDMAKTTLKNAEDAYKARMEDAEAALVSTKEMIRSFIAYKHDGLERLKDYYAMQINDIEALKEDLPPIPNTQSNPIVETEEPEPVEEPAVIDVEMLSPVETDVVDDTNPVEVAVNTHAEYDISAAQELKG